LRSGDRDVAEDTALAVDHVAVAASDPLGVIDDPVEPFSVGIVDIFEKGGEDGRPPGLDCAGEPSRFGQLGVDRSFIEVGQPLPDLRRLLLSEQQAGAFLHRPGGLDLLGRSQASKLRHSRFHCLLDRCSAPVSKSRRLIQIGSLTVPRRPSKLGVTRCHLGDHRVR
jgi:hypothetical protein